MAMGHVNNARFAIHFAFRGTGQLVVKNQADVTPINKGRETRSYGTWRVSPADMALCHRLKHDQ